ncbi:uncharacterized protein [Montipora capricornis]|uniref:uncharacterized protein n=1 Tax=Montipora capricornis TaxID=246305 RepID=UPI0035F1478B
MLLISSIGNSSAVQCAAQDPLEDLELADSIISKTPSSGFSKMLANNKKGFVLSSEIFDILNKLLKSDEENATGDVQLLCELFSGEKSTYHYSTEENRVIPANTPFCILGSTQLVNAAKLIARMDQGHALVDRLLIATPFAFCPTLTEMDAAREQLSTEVVDDFLELFRNVNSIDDNAVFEFDNDGKDLLRETLDHFVSELNDAISEGRVPPKSKKPDLIPRIACALHVLNHFMEQLLMGVPPSQPSNTISRTTLQNAASYVSHLETQKAILCQFVKGIIHTVYDKTIEQPTTQTVRDDILISQGLVVSYCSFKHGKRRSRAIAETEYYTAAESLQLEGFGTLVEFRVPRGRGSCKVFVKSKPNPWPNSTNVSIQEFDNAVAKPLHNDITAPMREYLRSNSHISE